MSAARCWPHCCAVQTFLPATKAKLKQAVLDKEGTPGGSGAESGADGVTPMLVKIHSAPGLHVPAKGDKILIIHSDEVGLAPVHAAVRACRSGSVQVSVLSSSSHQAVCCRRLT